MVDGAHITKQATNKLVQCLKLSIRNSNMGVCKNTKSQHSISRDKNYKSYVAVSFSPEHYLMCSRFCLVWTLLL